MSERTQRRLKIIGDFRSVEGVTDPLDMGDEFTPWAHGGYFNEKAAYERIKGKVLHSSDTTGGHVLTLQQLSFSNRDVVFVHQAETWRAEEDLSNLFIPEEPPYPIPTEPFIFEQD